MKRLTEREVRALRKEEDHARTVRYRLRKDPPDLARLVKHNVEELLILQREGFVRPSREPDPSPTSRTLEELIASLQDLPLAPSVLEDQALAAIGAMIPPIRRAFMDRLEDVNWEEHRLRPRAVGGKGVPLGSGPHPWAADLLGFVGEGRPKWQVLKEAKDEWGWTHQAAGRALKRLRDEGLLQRWTEKVQGKRGRPRKVEYVGLAPLEDRSRRVQELYGLVKDP